ncbi:MAG: hypothetical protein H6686_12815 [Fibrobacteria bacterium]|nr:hypothetical protein [Fibrobacteria bacterium]
MVAALFLWAQFSSGCRDVAKAYDESREKLLYVEDRVRRPCPGARSVDSVKYLGPDGSNWGSKVIRWRSDPYLPEVETRLEHLSRRTSIRFEGKQALVETTKDGKRRRRKVDLPDGAVVDAGIDSWMVANLPRIVAGEELVVPILLPELGKVVDFVASTSNGTDRSKDLVEVTLAPKSLLLRALPVRLKATYRPSSGHLVAYQGISDVRGPDGKNLKVSMRYQGWKDLAE